MTIRLELDPRLNRFTLYEEGDRPVKTDESNPPRPRHHHIAAKPAPPDVQPVQSDTRCLSSFTVVTAGTKEKARKESGL